MTTDETWDKKYWEIMEYMLTHKRRPSKHRIEDHLMLNWMKHNKKLQAQGKMKPERLEKFDKLMEVAQRYQKINQNAYVHTGDELDLF